MFLANVRNAGGTKDPYYPGAFEDYPARKLELQAMSEVQVTEMKNDVDYWYRTHAEKL